MNRYGIGFAAAAAAFTAFAAPIVEKGEKIAFLGDSITQFGNEQDGGYVNLVMDGLENAGVKAFKIPAGVSGHKSDQMLARLERDVLSKKPDWMVLSCGVNDVGHGAKGVELEPYKANISAILDKCAAAGVKVLVATPSLCTDVNWKESRLNRKLDGYCDFLRAEAAARKLPLADINADEKAALESPDLPPDGLTVDHLHMNGYGNQLMARSILAAFGLDAGQLDAAVKRWSLRRRAMMPLVNSLHKPANLVTVDTWKLIRRRAAEKGEPVEKYVMSKIEDRAPDIDWRKYRYETEVPRLSEDPADGLHGRVAPLEAISAANAAGDESDRTVSLVAWRNERVNAQIVLWTRMPAEQVRVRFSPLKGDAGEIPASAASARFVRYTTATRPDAATKVTSYVGDILDDAESLSMTTNAFRPVWLTVKVPAAAAAGTYKGSVSAIAAGGARVDFPVELEVLPRTLPDPADWTFFLDLWQHPWAVARYHGVKPFSPEHYALMRPLWKELADAGQKVITTTITDLPWNHQNYDPYHSMVRHIRTKDGGFRRDFSLWDQYVAFCESCGLGPQIHCYTMATWGHVVYWEDEETGDIQKAVLKPGTPEHEEFWGPFLEEFRDHVKAQRRLGRVYIALDERSREELYATASLIEKRGKGLKLEMAGNKKPSEFEGITVDNYCQYIAHITPEYLDEVHKTRPSDMFTSTFYVCCGPQRPNTFVDSPLYESLWVGVYAAAAKIDGLLRWAYVNWPRDPMVDSTFGHWRPGDTFLVYPGCRTSPRWEMLRDGIETCEKIRILRAEGRAGERLEKALAAIDFNAAKAPGAETAAATEAAVAEVMAAVEECSR